MTSMAIGAIHALRESGLRIPEDMAVMGFDNLTSSKYIEGGITTIANPYEDMLSVAVNILTKRTQKPADVAAADRAAPESGRPPHDLRPREPSILRCFA